MPVIIKNARPTFTLGGIDDTEPFIEIEHWDGDTLSMFEKTIRLRFQPGMSPERARKIKNILKENIVSIDEF